METKRPWESRTLLLGALSSILGGVAMLLPQAQPMLDWLNANGALIATGWGVLAMGLRLITKGKVSLGD